MKCIFWNVRGAGRNCFTSSIKTIVANYGVDVCVILEPRISGDRAISVARTMGFQNCHIEEADGFAGGIWVCWNGGATELQVVLSTKQTVTAIVTYKGVKWALTAVYGSPCPRTRKHLWKLLDDIAGIVQDLNLPWVMAGDFNEILNLTEKKGGRPRFTDTGFNDCLYRNLLIDMGFVGQQFTWVNSTTNLNPIRSRLDRGVCNMNWQIQFPESQITHLPRIASDHCPIMLSLQSNHHPRSQFKPFKFFMMWIDHPDYKRLVNQVWQTQSLSLEDKISETAKQLQVWNKETFGNIFSQKKTILKRLAGIQNALDRNVNPYLHRLERELQLHLTDIMEKEEKYWLQKSRITWLKEGDRNTKFFHLSTLIRRRRNKLEGLFDENNVWRKDKEDMMTIAVSYFQGLFSESGQAGLPNYWPNLFPRIDGSTLDDLNADVTEEEIRNALFSIGGLKAPGPDGFPAIFFQNSWDSCSVEVIDMVKKAFLNAKLPENLNQTLIALIPKSENPTSMANLRPISLCNTTYKIISKILVSRIRPMLNGLISPA